jgi:hypothetical protein
MHSRPLPVSVAAILLVLQQRSKALTRRRMMDQAAGGFP